MPCNNSVWKRLPKSEEKPVENLINCKECSDEIVNRRHTAIDRLIEQS